MPRQYMVTDDVAIDAAEDIVEITCVADKTLFISRIMIQQITTVVSEMIDISINRATTAGSGGTTVGANPLDPGDAADGATIDFNNTTPASTLTEIANFAFNVLAGLDLLFPPDDVITLGGQDILVIVADAAPSASITFKVTIWFTEVG